jgi:hypothetical protein
MPEQTPETAAQHLNRSVGLASGPVTYIHPLFSEVLDGNQTHQGAATVMARQSPGPLWFELLF